MATEQAAQSMAASTERSVTQQIKGVTRLTRVFGMLASAAGAVVSVVRTLGVVMEYVNNVFGDGEKKARDFMTALDPATAGNAASRLAAIRNEVAGLQQEMEAAMSAPWWDIRGRNQFGRNDIAKQLSFMQRAEAAAARQLHVVEERAQAEAKAAEAAKEVEGIQKRITDYQRELMDPDTRWVAEWGETLNKLIALQKGSADSDFIAKLQQMLEALIGVSDERNRRKAEEADKAARKAADEMRKVMQQFTRDFFAEFRRELSTVSPDIRAIGTKLDLLNRNTNRKY